MTNPTTNIPILDDDAVAKIQARKAFQYGTMVSLPVAERDALCQTVRALRAENELLIQERDAAKQLVGTDLRGQIEGVFGDQEHVETRFRKRAIQVCRDRASEWGYLGLSNTWYAGKEEAANDLASELEQLK